MSRYELIHGSCADQQVDAVVNAANRYLAAGGGICGVIFAKAGNQLAAACANCKPPLRDGEAAITPSFNMTNCTHIIHAVGPNFAFTPTAFKELYEAYYSCFQVLKDNGLHSISVPLISSGIFGGSLEDPAGESAKQFKRAYDNFVKDNPDYDIDVKYCAFSAKEYATIQRVCG